MKQREARTIISEMLKWMRGVGDYTRSNPDPLRCKPYTDQEFEDALETAIESIDMLARINNNSTQHPIH